jgi:hypothetical protein
MLNMSAHATTTKEILPNVGIEINVKCESKNHQQLHGHNNPQTPMNHQRTEWLSHHQISLQKNPHPTKPKHSLLNTILARKQKPHRRNMTQEKNSTNSQTKEKTSELNRQQKEPCSRIHFLYLLGNLTTKEVLPNSQRRTIVVIILTMSNSIFLSLHQSLTPSMSSNRTSTTQY